MLAARDARAVAVGVPTGSFDGAQLRAAGADVVLGSLGEFPSWYAGFLNDRTKERTTDAD